MYISLVKCYSINYFKKNKVRRKWNIYIYRERERERERERGKVNECCKSMNIGLTIIFRNILWEKKILGPV